MQSIPQFERETAYFDLTSPKDKLQTKPQLFSVLYRIFPTKLVEKLAGYHSSLKTTPFLRNAYNVLNGAADQDILLELLIVLLKMVESGEANTELILNMNKQFSLNTYNYNLLNLQAQCSKGVEQANPRQMFQNVNSVGYKRYQPQPRPQYMNFPFRAHKPLSTILNPAQIPREKPIGSPSSVVNERHFSPIYDSIKENKSEYSKISKESSFKSPTVASFKEESPKQINPSYVFRRSKTVKAIKMLMKRGMSNKELEELGDFILDPEKNLPVIKRFLVNDEWEKFNPDELNLLLYQKKTVGFYVNFKPMKRNWIFINKLIKS
jgi:hypothetical protein